MMTNQLDDSDLLQMLDQPGLLWIVKGGQRGMLGGPCPTLRRALQQASEHSSRGESPGPITQMSDNAVVIPAEQIYRLWKTLGYVQ